MCGQKAAVLAAFDLVAEVATLRGVVRTVALLRAGGDAGGVAPRPPGRGWQRRRMRWARRWSRGWGGRGGRWRGCRRRRHAAVRGFVQPLVQRYRYVSDLEPRGGGDDQGRINAHLGVKCVEPRSGWNPCMWNPGERKVWLYAPTYISVKP